jgi:Domain of unknown function (DUF4349)
MKQTPLFIILAGALALAACARAGAPAPTVQLPAATGAPAMPREALGVAPAPSMAIAPAGDLAKTEAANQATSPDRLVVKNADLSIVVTDVMARVKAIQDMTSAMGGFVVSANVYQTTTRDGTKVPQAQMVIRVPVEKLDTALDQIKSNTVEVQNENQSGQDVTDQYVDLQSRLKAKEAAEAQLLQIMQDAKKTEDVLAVYAQLQQIESDIEVLKGQIKYTEQSAALSAISVNILAEETVKPLEVGGWKPQGVARDAIQSLIYYLQDFVDFMIRFVLLILPVLITVLVPLYLAFLLLRWIFRRLRKPKPAEAAEAPKKK